MLSGGGGFSFMPGTWVVTPEPMSLSLMLLGSIVMVKRRMHQRRQQYVSDDAGEWR
jgi:hypothetical protein